MALWLRLPFLALWEPQTAANGSKARHKAKAKNRVDFMG
jgi:hypothetical protein